MNAFMSIYHTRPSNWHINMSFNYQVSFLGRPIKIRYWRVNTILCWVGKTLGYSLYYIEWYFSLFTHSEWGLLSKYLIHKGDGKYNGKGFTSYLVQATIYLEIEIYWSYAISTILQLVLAGNPINLLRYGWYCVERSKKKKIKIVENSMNTSQIFTTFSWWM